MTKLSFYKHTYLLFASIITIMLLLACVVWYCFSMAKSSRESREFQQMIDCLNVVRKIYLNYPSKNILDNFEDDDDNAILSWRVRYAILQDSLFEITYKIDTSKSWNSYANIGLIDKKPSFLYYPYHQNHDGNTCMLANEDIARLPRNEYIKKIVREKILIVLVNPQYSALWSKPKDISFKSIESSQIEYEKFNICGNLVYLSVNGDIVIKKLPIDKSDWIQLCHLSQEEESDIEKHLEQLWH